MGGYIYKTTNLINGKIYIGQHQRQKFTTRYKGSGTLITGAFIKYGKQNFIVELLERCSSQEQLDEREEYGIKKLDSRNPLIGYNQSKGGRENDAKMTSRKDAEAVHLREIAYSQDEKKNRLIRLKDGNNGVVMGKDDRTREVFIDKVPYYEQLGGIVLY